MPLFKKHLVFEFGYISLSFFATLPEIAFRQVAKRKVLAQKFS